MSVVMTQPKELKMKIKKFNTHLLRQILNMNKEEWEVHKKYIDNIFKIAKKNKNTNEDKQVRITYKDFPFFLCMGYEKGEKD